MDPQIALTLLAHYNLSGQLSMLPEWTQNWLRLGKLCFRTWGQNVTWLISGLMSHELICFTFIWFCVMGTTVYTTQCNMIFQALKKLLDGFLICLAPFSFWPSFWGATWLTMWSYFKVMAKISRFCRRIMKKILLVADIEGAQLEELFWLNWQANAVLSKIMTKTFCGLLHITTSFQYLSYCPFARIIIMGNRAYSHSAPWMWISFPPVRSSSLSARNTPFQNAFKLIHIV